MKLRVDVENRALLLVVEAIKFSTLKLRDQRKKDIVTTNIVAQ